MNTYWGGQKRKYKNKTQNISRRDKGKVHQNLPLNSKYSVNSGRIKKIILNDQKNNKCTRIIGLKGNKGLGLVKGLDG